MVTQGVVNRHAGPGGWAALGYERPGQGVTAASAGAGR
jgi:hypothetical protein